MLYYVQIEVTSGLTESYEKGIAEYLKAVNT
jgi:hypothetical protein